MKLLTKELKKRFAVIGSQESNTDPIIIAKFFHPYSNRTRYATERNPDDNTFFGFVDGDFPERGYFSLDEMESVHINGLPMERDKFWQEKLFSSIKMKYDV